MNKSTFGDRQAYAMTLHSVMELYNRHHAPGAIVRSPVFLPHAHTLPHHLQARLPLPLALLNQMPRHVERNKTQSPEKPTSSFSIADILNGTIGRKSSADGAAPQKRRKVQQDTNDLQKVMRPWDDCGSRSSRSCSPVDTSTADDEEIDVGDEKPKPQGKNKNSPLDALFKMTNKTFEGLDSSGLLGAGMFNIKWNRVCP